MVRYNEEKRTIVIVIKDNLKNTLKQSSSVLLLLLKANSIKFMMIIKIPCLMLLFQLENQNNLVGKSQFYNCLHEQNSKPNVEVLT